jgi:GAF domain-containing protein
VKAVAVERKETKKAASAGIELEQSSPVFDRARRLASAVFGGGVGADIVLVDGGSVWCSCDPEGRARVEASRGTAVVASGKPLWIADAADQPGLDPQGPACGVQGQRFYVAVPIRLEDGSIPGVLTVGGPEPRPYDAELLGSLQDVADFIADEWTRVRATRARELSVRERDEAFDRIALSEERLKLAVDMADLYVWEIDYVGRAAGEGRCGRRLLRHAAAVRRSRA